MADAYNPMMPMQEDMPVLERIEHNTAKTAEYQANTEHELREIEEHIAKMKGGGNMSEVAEIIAARDRGDNGYSRNGDDGLLGGGGLLAGLVLGSILRNDNRGNDCAVSNCQNSLTELASDFNAAQHASTLTAIQTAGAASVAATHNASQIEQNADLGRAICNAESNVAGLIGGVNTNVLLGQARTDLELCKSSGITNGLIAASSAKSDLENCKSTGLIIASVVDAKNQALLTAKDAAMQLEQCCCELKMQAEANTNKLLQQMCADREQALRDELAEERRCRDRDKSDFVFANFGTLITTLTNSLNPVKVG